MARKAVFGSKSISGYEYDPETQLLDIEFQNGRTYTFRRVPPIIVEQFESAESPGGFYHANIKGRYT